MRNDEQIVRTFMNLVRIYSPTGEEATIAIWLRDYLLDLGVTTHIDAVGNVVGYLDGNEDYECYLLNAHMDTVEPCRNVHPVITKNGWICSKSNTILGADNKASIAAILELMRTMIKLPSSARRPLEIVFTVGEESGNRGAHSLEYARLKSTRGYISDTSGNNFGDVIISSPAYYRFDITMTGKSAHASVPEKSVNVLPVFASLVSRLPLGRVTETAVANVGVVRCGEVVNTIPGSLVAAGEIRSIDEEELEAIRNDFQVICQQTATKGLVNIDVVWTKENGALVIDTESEFFQRTLSIVHCYNSEPIFVRTWGCSDANIFAANGLTIINIADGSQHAHTSNERIHRDDLCRLVDLYYDLVSVSGSSEENVTISRER